MLDLSGVFDGWMRLTIILAILSIFGIWKLIEIVIWVFSNVVITW